jgi:predicted metal-dependent RNase
LRKSDFDCFGSMLSGEILTGVNIRYPEYLSRSITDTSVRRCQNSFVVSKLTHVGDQVRHGPNMITYTWRFVSPKDLL